MNYVKTVPTWANNTFQYTATRINNIFSFTRSCCFWWWWFILYSRTTEICYHKFQDGCLSIAVLVVQIAAIPSSGKGMPPAVCALLPVLSEWTEFTYVHSVTAVEWKTTCRWSETEL